MMTDISGAAGVDANMRYVHVAYMDMTRRKRVYGAVMLIVFVALMVSGFRLADGRNAGGFWNGVGNVFQFPGEVLAEAGEKITNLPGLMWKFLAEHRQEGVAVIVIAQRQVIRHLEACGAVAQQRISFRRARIGEVAHDQAKIGIRMVAVDALDGGANRA